MQSNGEIVVEYSEDMEPRAFRLGYTLEVDGYRVVYRRVDGAGVLVFRVNGYAFDWTQFHVMVRHALPRPAGGGARPAL